MVNIVAGYVLEKLEQQQEILSHKTLLD